jgi:hypothetical protein
MGGTIGREFFRVGGELIRVEGFLLNLMWLGVGPGLPED